MPYGHVPHFDERHDIESDIFSKLTSEREKIIKQYQTSCALIDAGYSGNSQYSRLIQTADIVAFWVRQMAAIKKNPDLFNSKDDSRKIKLVEDIEKYWRKKLKIL